MNEVIPHIDLYDSEFFDIENVLASLNQKQKKNVHLESFRREIIERFEDIGLIVRVKVYDTNVADVYAFDVDIYDRCEKLDYDYDQQTWEVRKDILGIEPEKKDKLIEVPRDPKDTHTEETHNHE